MKIFKVSDVGEYSKVVMSTLETGQLDGSPLFDSYNKFLTFFDVPDNFIELLYDDNGEEIWDNNDEEILPKPFIEKYLRFRLIEQLEFSFPFYIVIDGDRSYNNDVEIGFNTFYEIQQLEKI